MLEAISLILAILSTAIAIYQWAVLREGKKRRSELQFLLAGIHQLTVSKQVEWINQIQLYLRVSPEPNPEVLQLLVRAKDNFIEISQMINALESVIDTETSAVQAMLKKSIESARLNDKLQATGRASEPFAGEEAPPAQNGEEQSS